MVERLYSARQVADLLGVSSIDVNQWIHSGLLEAEQLAGDIRVSERGVVRFLRDLGIDLGSVLRAALEQEAERGAESATAAAESAPETPDAEPGPMPPDSRSARAEAVADVTTRLAEAILEDALKRGAEAIFLEPLPNSLSLKLRIDDRWHEKPNFASRLPPGLGPLLMTQFRTLARVSEAGRQEATFQAHVDGRARSFRIETCSTPHGDGLLIRPTPL